jgi:GMP synthase (glutamine-hydrolysing)
MTRAPASRGRSISPRAAFAARARLGESCWGLQLATVALGGLVRRNPQGRELPIARAITLTGAGRVHPLLASRPPIFDARCSHMNEIEMLPPNSQVLAANELSAIQAIAAQTPRQGSFLGTQYHPEHTLAVSAALIEMRSRSLSRALCDQAVRDCRDRKRLSRTRRRAYRP